MNIKAIIALAVGFCSFSLALAIPAKPGIIDYVQPDGEIVKVRIFGDENAHYYTSDDGYPLIANADTLFFAQLEGLNEVTFSSHIAKNVCDRDAACNFFLSGIDKMFLVTSIKEKIEHSRKERAIQNKQVGKFGLFPDASFPTEGENRTLVILVEFSDMAFDVNYNASEYFNSLLNQNGFSEFGAYGSAKDYFSENSSGLFQPIFDVKGPVRLSKPAAYYGANGREQIDLNAGRMIIEACLILDVEVDFSNYDCDNDGKIDNVFVFYAGKGEASGGNPMTIWPHSSDVKYFTEEPVMLDGKILGRYACSNEIMNGRPDGIGTFVHEFCHVMGLPDLYSTTYTDAFTLGAWDIMDRGSYNNDSMTPPLLSSFEREALGWSQPYPVYEGNIEIEPLGVIQSGYEYVIDESEKYYLETRCREGWDSFIPGEGLLLWHVNYSQSVWASNRVNVLADKQYVDLIEADGFVSENTRDGDCFPGVSNVSSVSVATHPSMQPWSKDSDPFALTNITFENGNVSLDFDMNEYSSYGENTIPVFNDDCLISDDSLEVSWAPVAEAQSYNVDVKEIDGSEVVSETLDFDSGLRGIPQGWEVKFGLPSNGIINPENNTPMLGLLQNGGGLISPRFDKDLSHMSFSVMACGSEGRSATLDLYVYKNGKWEICNEYVVPISQTLSKVSYAFEESGIREFKLVCSGETGVITFIDDLSVECYDTEIGASLFGFPLNYYTQTKIAIPNLKPATGYVICVSSNINERRSVNAIKRIFTNENSALHSASSQSVMYLINGHITGYLDKPQTGVVVSFDGRILDTFQMSPGYNSIDVRMWGACVIVIDGHTFKIMNY